MTTADAVAQFLADLATERRSPHTIAAYGRDLRTFATFVRGAGFADITPGMLTAFMATSGVQERPCGTPRAKTTINRYRVSLKALFAWGEARWLVPRNPTRILRCKRHRGLPPTVLTDSEIQRLLAFDFKGKWAERDRSLLHFMLATGCRLAETVALNTGHIDWTSGTVTLHLAKGGDPETVTATPVVLAALFPLASGTDAEQPIFRSVNRRRLSVRQVQRIVANRCREAGIAKAVTPHTLRHTFATRLYNRTQDIRLVQQALRHEFITTTQIYAQVDPQRMSEALSWG